MKINFVVPHLEISGGMRIMLTYADLLAARGHEVHVISTSINRKKSIKNILEFKKGSIREFFGGKPYWFRHLKADVIRTKNISAHTVPDADVIIAGNYKKADQISVLPKEKGVPFEFIMHDERLYHGDPQSVADTYSKDMKKICVSHWLQDIIKRDFNQNSFLLINPIDTNLFYPDPSPGGRDENEVRVLMMHHNFTWKGVDDGVSAFEEVKKQTGENMKLILFGARFKTIDVAYDEYHYDPPQEQMRRIYSDADIFLCPSEWEGLGLPAMEALACNTAVVTYDTGGSRSYAFPDQTAFVAEHQNTEDLTNKLVEAVTNPEKRERIAENGFRFITKEHDSWEESTEKLERIFEQEL